MMHVANTVGADEAPTLSIVSGATLLVLLVFTVPLTTLDATARALAAGPGAQAWILSGMPLGAATGLLGSGALGDNHGRRKVFLWGLALLAAASALGALAQTDLFLILARVVQGFGGAAILACGLGLIAQAFADDRARTRATAVWAAALGAGVATGPIFAALLAQIGGWRAAHVGTGLLAAALGLAGRAILPETDTDRHNPMDWTGTILLAAGLAAAMSGLTEMRLGWARPSVLLLIGAASSCSRPSGATRRGIATRSSPSLSSGARISSARP